MHRMLFLAIFAAITMKTVLGAVCEGLAEQNEQKLVTVDAVCKNQTLTLSWIRDANARPTPYHIQCKNGTRTVFTTMSPDESYALMPSGTTDISFNIFQWPVQCTVHVCYSNLNLRTSFSVLPTTCSFPNPSVSPVSSTSSFPPSTKDIPTTIDRKASIASPLNPDQATTAPSTTLSMVNEQSIISSSFSTEIAVSVPNVTSMITNEDTLHSISTEIAATATGTSVTMLTTLPSTDAMQQTVNGGMTRANGAATTSHILLQSKNTTVIQMPSNVRDTDNNMSLSVSLSITIPVTVVVLAFIIIISLCWMVMSLLKKSKNPNDYTNSALQDYDPVILSLTKPHICGSTVTLTSPLENHFIHELPPPTCATPNASISEEQASSELVHTLEGIKNIISQEEDHIKPSQSPWDHSSVSFTDFGSDLSSQESSQTVHTQGYIYTRRHSYESLAYIHQSDYIVPCSLDNTCRAHVSTN